MLVLMGYKLDPYPYKNIPEKSTPKKKTLYPKIYPINHFPTPPGYFNPPPRLLYFTQIFNPLLNTTPPLPVYLGP